VGGLCFEPHDGSHPACVRRRKIFWGFHLNTSAAVIQCTPSLSRSSVAREHCEQKIRCREFHRNSASRIAVTPSMPFLHSIGHVRILELMIAIRSESVNQIGQEGGGGGKASLSLEPLMGARIEVLQCSKVLVCCYCKYDYNKVKVSLCKVVDREESNDSQNSLFVLLRYDLCRSSQTCS